MTQYLVRSIGYWPEFELWYSLNVLANAAGLVREYETVLPK